MLPGFPFSPADGYTDFGCYPLGYLCDDGEFLCADCVNDPTNPVHSGGEADGWRIEAICVLDDGEQAHCAHCNKVLVEDDEDEEPSPDDEDGFLVSRGPLGARTEAIFAGKSLGIFDRESRARAAIRLEMRRSGFYPNVWAISDHGNAHLTSVQ